LENLARTVPYLVSLPPADWSGFHPCPHCQPSSTLRFNWTENCCNLCRPFEEISGRETYTWVYHRVKGWSICYSQNEVTVCKRLQCSSDTEPERMEHSHCDRFLGRLRESHDLQETQNVCPSSDLVRLGFDCLGCACENGAYTCTSTGTENARVASSGEWNLQCNRTMTRVIGQGLLIRVENL
uniref:PLAC domain-containing protein n=1 Tax=Echinostoma caproni TaxID=27848 RepID=A0A183A8H3_9TREM